MNMGVSQLLYMYVISLNNVAFNNNHEKLKHAKIQQYESMYTKWELDIITKTIRAHLYNSKS